MSLNKTEVAPAVVTVTVNPSSTSIVSTIPRGKSLTAFTVTKKLSSVRVPQPESLAVRVTVADPTTLSV